MASARRRPGAAFAASLGIVAGVVCHQAPAPPVSPGTDAGAHDSGGPPAAPEAFEPRLDAPRFVDWTCRPGWRAEPAAPGHDWGPTVCLPPPREECDDTEWQLPGDVGCRRLGPACPGAGEVFPSEEVIRSRAPGFAGPVRYVRPDARPRGTGSREAPFRTLDEALQTGVLPGLVVALAVGDHPGGPRLRRAVAVVGACVASTRLLVRSPDEPALGLLLTGDGGQLVTTLTVAADGPQTLGLLVRDNASPVRVRDVAILDTALSGLSVDGGAVSLEGLVIRRAGLQGLKARDGATVEGRGLVIADVWGSGLWIAATADDPLSTLTVEDVAVLRSGHHGLDVGTPSEVLVTGALFERSAVAGVLVSPQGPPVRVALEDVVLRGPGGHGLQVHGGAEVSVLRSVLERRKEVALLVASYHARTPTDLVLEDVVVRDTEPADSGMLGVGIGFVGPGTLHAARTLLLRNRSTALALVADDPDRRLEATLEDVAALETGSRGDGQLGWGIGVMRGAQATGTRLWLEGNRDVSLATLGWGLAPETRTHVEHVRVLATRPAACGGVPEGQDGSCVVDGRSYAGGSGVVVAEGGRLTLDSFEVAGSSLAGLMLGPEGVLTARAGRISGNTIGLNLMQTDVDPDRFVDVWLAANELEVGREDLPLPDPSTLLQGL